MGKHSYFRMHSFPTAEVSSSFLIFKYLEMLDQSFRETVWQKLFGTQELSDSSRTLVLLHSSTISDLFYLVNAATSKICLYSNPHCGLGTK